MEWLVFIGGVVSGLILSTFVIPWPRLICRMSGQWQDAEDEKIYYRRMALAFYRDFKELNGID